MSDTNELGPVVVRQAVELYALRDEVKELRSAISQARLHIICIGGPLNDNVKKYSPDQLVTFQKILDALGD